MLKAKKRLTPKEKKRLAKLLEEKQKKAKRAVLLQNLATLQVPETERKLLQTTAKLGTAKSATVEELVAELPESCTAAIQSFQPRRKRKRVPRAAKKKVVKQSYAVGSFSDSEDEDDTEDEDEEEVQEEETESNTVDDSACQPESGVSSSPERSSPMDTPSPSACTNPGTEDSKQPGTKAMTKPAQPVRGATKSTASATSMPTVYVPVERDPAIQAARLELPILAEEQAIMEAIRENSIVIIAGATGSGKTTQLPQFLYEAGYTKPVGDRPGLQIGITEPRRVAAVSMAKRVAQEMGLTQREVSYQIRYEGTASENTEIKFMTDGVLLKEIESSFLLGKYSAIIVDEAHERSVFTDILLGLLSRIVRMRLKRGKPLKLIIMSATLRVEDFTENRHLFETPPPVIKVDARQFDVSVYHSKHTPNDDEYMQAALRKVCKIHRELPEGGILVFVTGQQEVHWLCSKLKRTFPATTKGFASSSSSSSSHAAKTGVKRPLCKINLDDVPAEPTFADLDIEDGMEEDRGAGGDDYAGSSDDEVHSGGEVSDDEDMIFGDEFDSALPMRVLPMYGLLSPERQAEVFAPPPDGVRLCVVATNVAETSLTIPNTKYVVDTGKVKRRYYDKVTGASTFRIGWTSVASANQRAGRAGRTGPGHCYRLFSSAVLGNEFEKFSEPEISHRPIDDLFLQLKSMSIPNVENFPFPTPPPAESLKAAQKLLVSLGALEMQPLQGGKGMDSEITKLGLTMVKYPVSPRFGKMLTLARVHSLIPYVIATVAVLTVPDILISPRLTSNDGDEGDDDSETGKSREQHTKTLLSKWGCKGLQSQLGDVSLLLNAIIAAETAGCTTRFCEENGIRRKAVIEVRKLRYQLTSAVNANLKKGQIVLDPNLSPPTTKQTLLLRQLILSGLCDRTARKVDTTDMPTADRKRLRYAYQCMSMEEPVYLNCSSAMKFQKTLPEFVVFREIVETTKPFMQCVVGIQGVWLPRYAGQHCQLSDPLKIPEPSFDASTGTVQCHRTAMYGPHNWPIPAQLLPYPYGLEKYKWFAKLLLDGVVVKKLEKFCEHLHHKPSTILRPWAKLHPWVMDLLNALVSAKVDDRTSLFAVWQKRPNYLLKEYSAWFPQEEYAGILTLWPPIQ